jgi:hypothetical protein
MRCEESLENSCQGMWFDKENVCLREPDTNCEMEHCDFCVKIIMRNPESGAEEHKDRCM